MVLSEALEPTIPYLPAADVIAKGSSPMLRWAAEMDLSKAIDLCPQNGV